MCDIPGLVACKLSDAIFVGFDNHEKVTDVNLIFTFIDFY